MRDLVRTATSVWLLCVFGLCTATVATAGEESMRVILQSRQRDGDGKGTIIRRTAQWDPRKTAVVVVDMWNSHHCLDAKRRVVEMAPAMNRVLKGARDQGMLIIHAPSDCMAAYRDTPQRHRAQKAPAVAAPAKFQWNKRNPDREPPLPVTGGCDSANDQPRWTSQIETLEIAEQDAVSDNGQEIHNLLEQFGIENVIIMGVHTNMCVLGRPFGIRQMVYNQRNVVLCRDLTDTYHRDPGRHFQGVERVVAHIETYWCPTITSTDLTRKPAFRFKADRRKHLVMLIAESEYHTAHVLPVFADHFLLDDFKVSYVTRPGKNVHDLPGIEVLDGSDLMLVSVWRCPLPESQMKVLKRFVAAGKPVVGIRTASHAFALGDDQQQPAGSAQWPEFDREVLGGNYHMHYGNNAELGGPWTHVWTVPDMNTHPILAGVPSGEFRVPSWLYKTEPLGASARPLMLGRVQGHAEKQPVAWTNTHSGGGRVFYTSLGHPGDFTLKPFCLLLRNGICWVAGYPVANVWKSETMQDYLVALESYRVKISP